MRRAVSLIICIILISLSIQSQPAPLPKYYFRNPLNFPIVLAANFGELRDDHWHMGLDIRTKQKENQPVYAAADGYISHIGIRSQSFGRYIIIKHPNGYATLYAHLNDFFPALEKYVTAQQYKRESWSIELDFQKSMFPVVKSQFIAFSGNTGGSQGPHLHFEIRDSKTDRCINPLLFGLPVEDKVAPIIVRLAVYDRSQSVFEQSPEIYSLKKTDSGYIIPNAAVVQTGFDKISFAIQAYDLESHTTNPNGIFSAKLYVDDEPQIGFQLDSLNYTETEFITAHVDYKYRYEGGPFLQHLSHLPGDHGVEYRSFKGDGVISLSDRNIHTVSIEVKDPQFNTSILNFSIQHSDSMGLIHEKILADKKYGDSTVVFAPGIAGKFERADFQLSIPENCLYDTVHSIYYRTFPTAANAISALHQLNDPSIPLHAVITVKIKPSVLIADAWKDKLVMVRSYRGSNSVRIAELENTDKGIWLKARFGDLGAFRAFVDTIPPAINNPGDFANVIYNNGDTIDLSSATKISFEPRDNFGSVADFRAEVEDSTGKSQWLRFANDKGSDYVYEFDEHVPFGVYKLTVKVEDLVGNSTTKSWWFKRHAYNPPKKLVKKKKSIVKKKGR